MPRGRRPNPEESVSTNLHLPASVRTRLDLFLYSELEGRVPHGAYQRFFLERLSEFFGSRALDLSPFIGSLPGTHLVRGRPDTVEALEQALHHSQGNSHATPQV